MSNRSPPPYHTRIRVIGICTEEQPCSCCTYVSRSPVGVRAHHGVEDSEHFAHTGDDRNFVCLAAFDQAFIERLYDWVTADRTDGSHIQHVSDLGTSTPY